MPDTTAITPAAVVSQDAAVRARWAVTAVFLVNALLLVTYIVRIPSLKLQHALSESQLGIVLTLFGVAAILTMQFVGGLVARFGSVHIIRLGLVLVPVMLAAIGISGDMLQLCASVTLMGVVYGMLDVAMNAHAVAVERIRSRPIMNGCHAAWTIGAVVSSLLGAGAIRAGVSSTVHLLSLAGVLLLAGLVVSLWLLPASADRLAKPADGAKPARVGWRSGWTRPVLLLCLMGMTVMLCEAAVISWSGVYLHESRMASLTVATFGYMAFTLMQTAGRLVGDRLTMRFGIVGLLRVHTLVAAAGLLIVVIGQSPALGIIGFGVMGAGMSVLIPLIFSAVGHAGGDGPGAAGGVARATTFTYGGALLGPAIIGWFAQGFGLQWTFAGLIPIMVLVVLGSGRIGAAKRV